MSSSATLAPQREARVWPRALAPTMLLALALLGVAALWLSLLPSYGLVVDVGEFGSGDRAFLRGAYHREVNAAYTPNEQPYRWARGDAMLTLPPGQVGPAIFSARMHAAPQPAGGDLAFAIWAGGEQLRFAVPATVRIYRMLLSPRAAQGGVVRLQLASPTVTPPGDDRLLAVALDWVALSPVGVARPALPLLGGELAIVGLAALLLWANRAPAAGVAGGALATVLALAGLNLSARYWMGLGVWPLLAVAASLVGLSLVAQRLLPRSAGREARFARWLWLIVLGGLALRLVGVSAPGFVFNDLDIQSSLIGRVLSGEVYLFESAHEFGGGKTFYPSGPYVLALPLLLIQPALPFALHIGAALLDASAPIWLALLARELGLSRRTALLAAVLLAILPIQLTALWWGFFTNIGGQALLLLLLWLLLRQARRPSPGGAAALFVALSLVLLSHVGVLILSATAAVLVLGLAWLPPRPTAAAWRGLLAAGLGALAIFSLAYLSFVAAPMLGSAQGVLTGGALSAERLAEERAYIRRILPVALWRGVGMLPFLMLIPGVPLIWGAARRPLGRAVVAAWLITPLIFVVVEYLYLVQVRYIYFLAPLCCMALAAVLARLWARRAGRPVVVITLALIAWLGVFLWYNGAIIGIKMSLVPLTH